MSLLENHIQTIEVLCKEHKVDSLYLFGSAVSGDLKKDSDYDLLIRFLPDIALLDYAENYFSLLNKLETVLERKVDLVSEKALKNPILIDSINKSKRLIYECEKSEMHF